MTHLYDPLHLAHRIHVSTDDTGFCGHCTCGWRVTRPSREQRQADIDAHLTVRRTRGSHGIVAEGD